MTDYFALSRPKRKTVITKSKFDEDLVTPYFWKSISFVFDPKDLQLEEKINDFLNKKGIFYVEDLEIKSQISPITHKSRSNTLQLPKKLDLSNNLLFQKRQSILND